MKTYNELLENLEEIKLNKKQFTDIKLYFNETAIFVGGLLKGKGNVRGCDSASRVNVFIPTAKGYESSEWKKSEFYKMGRVELTEELFNKLTSFIQDETPTIFVRDTGVSVANVVASHINSKVDYKANKMRQ